jgi:ketosteroid isomerase-like protein
MSTADLAREVLALLGERELETLIERTDPEVEWRSFFAGLGERGAYRGHSGMREYVSDLTEAWDYVAAEVDSVVAADDVAVAVGRIRYRGRSSDIEAADPALWMLKFRDGKVVLFRAFRDPASVLERVGLTD